MFLKIIFNKNVSPIFAYILEINTSTDYRRIGIEDQFMFECKCKRCQDATEFGTFYGGICCSTCNNFTPDGENVTVKGTLYQQKPLEISSDWKCNHCDSVSPGDECKKVLKMLYDNIQEAIANSQGSTQVMELVSETLVTIADH